MDYIQEYAFQIAVIFALGIGGYLIEKYGKQVLKNTVNSLVQMAEVAVEGSGLGEAKKEWVIKQLEATGIKVNKKVDKLIDDLVEIMNKKKTSLVDVIAKK